MIKTGIETPLYERTFIRQALFGHGMRLDGRGAHDCRELSFSLDRGECSANSRVQLGSTLVYAIVTGEIVAPYPDRPVEGVLQFSASVSRKMESAAGTVGGAVGGGVGGAGVASWEITRMLERAVSESESLDTESLCIVGGEWVWQLTTEVRVLDGSGGNILDACVMAAMSALRAFRKPDVTVVASAFDVEAEAAAEAAAAEAAAEEGAGAGVGGSTGVSVGFNDCVEFKNSSDVTTTASSKQNTNGGKGNMGAQGAQNRANLFTAVAQKSSRILVHSSHDREPLPLALHHTPLSVTIGILTPAIVATTTSASEDPEQLLPANQVMMCIMCIMTLCCVPCALCQFPKTQCYCFSILYPLSSILYALCSMLYALCSMLYALCSMLYALCSMLYALCSMLCALCSVLCALCSVLCALCSMLYALCSMLYALYSMLCALCSVLCALCSVLYDQCSVLCALCNLNLCNRISCRCVMHISTPRSSHLIPTPFCYPLPFPTPFCPPLLSMICRYKRWCRSPSTRSAESSR
jgi:exosome complex RNA-binding protein Rrp42 (RNase PH superfamily)